VMAFAGENDGRARLFRAFSAKAFHSTKTRSMRAMRPTTYANITGAEVWVALDVSGPNAAGCRDLPARRFSHPNRENYS
jgi:hypothetical protein